MQIYRLDIQQEAQRYVDPKNQKLLQGVGYYQEKFHSQGLNKLVHRKSNFSHLKASSSKILIQNTCKKILEFYSNWRNFNKNKLKPSKPYIYCLQLKGQMESQEKLYSSLNYEIFYPSIPFLISKMNQQNACNYAKQIINSQFALDSVLEQQYLWDAFFLLLLRNNDIVKI